STLGLSGSPGANRRLDVQVSNNGGSTWQTASTVIAPSSGPAWYPVTLYSPSGGNAFITTAQLNQLAVRLTSASTTTPGVTLNNSGNGTGATVTIPAHPAGDVVVISAYRANNTPASAPASGGDFTWTTVQSGGAN